MKDSRTKIIMLATAMALMTGWWYGAAQAVPPCRYTVETIVGPPCGPNDNAHIRVRAINEAGHVVGAYECPGGQPRPFKWSPEDGFEALPLPPGYPNGVAVDIADDGVILGVTSPITLPSTGYVWDGKSFQLIGSLPGTHASIPLAMNNDHVVVGYLMNSGEGWSWFAFRWEDGVLLDISPALSVGETQAADISETGLITGLMGWTTASPNSHAFIKNGRILTDLGLDLPGASATEARAVNDIGKACGVWRSPQPTFPGYVIRAFFWDGKMLVDLPTGAFSGAEARDINDNSVIVGNLVVNTGGSGPGCLWDDMRMYYIETLLPPLPYYVAEGIAINDAGQIAAFGIDNGDEIGVVLTPVFTKSGDTNCDEIVNVDDLLNVINQWLGDGGREDINDDGIVNAFDLFEVIVNWG